MILKNDKLIFWDEDGVGAGYASEDEQEDDEIDVVDLVSGLAVSPQSVSDCVIISNETAHNTIILALKSLYKDQLFNASLSSKTGKLRFEKWWESHVGKDQRHHGESSARAAWEARQDEIDLLVNQTKLWEQAANIWRQGYEKLKPEEL